MEEKIPVWFTNCLTKNKAVLYQDGRIQIGLTKDIKAPEAHFNLFYSNKSGATLKNFSAGAEQRGVGSEHRLHGGEGHHRGWLEREAADHGVLRQAVQGESHADGVVHVQGKSYELPTSSLWW